MATKDEIDLEMLLCSYKAVLVDITESYAEIERGICGETDAKVDAMRALEQEKKNADQAMRVAEARRVFIRRIQEAVEPVLKAVELYMEQNECECEGGSHICGKQQQEQDVSALKEIMQEMMLRERDMRLETESDK